MLLLYRRVSCKLNRPILVVMVGIPASGKSYKAKELSELYNANIYSSETYRKELLGDENCQDNNELVFNTLFNDIYYALCSGENCILDAANTTLKSRREIFNRFGNISDIIAYIITTTIDNCINRDLHRERTVGEGIINKFVLSYEFPQMFEGFSNIIIDSDLKDSYNTDKEQRIKNRMYRFSQNNPHHKYTVGKHCFELASQFNELDNRYIAGLWHDVGKMFTCKFDENNICHYTGHANYSTYYLLSNLDIINVSDTYSISEILFYINYHMKIREIVATGKDSTKEKYRNLFGMDYTMGCRYDKLIEFMNADNIASGKKLVD